MTEYILINLYNDVIENLVRQVSVGESSFCLQEQIVPFATDKFTAEMVGMEGFSVSNLSSSVRYRLRWTDSKQYLSYTHDSPCFGLTSNINNATVWEDRTGNNEIWILTTNISTSGGTDERKTSLYISIIEAKECNNESNSGCNTGTTCNYYTGICGSCASCGNGCDGPCPSGYNCEVVGNEYTCVQKSMVLIYLFIILGIFGFIGIIILISYFASR